MERLGVRIEDSSKMDSVIDKEQSLSEGHPEAEDRKLDLEELTDDEEVALNLPRKGAEERDPPGEEIRDLPEWFRMEPPHGARPKWNRLGRPTSVIEEPRCLGAEATGGIDGLEAKEGRMRAPAPRLSPPRQDIPGAGTPPMRDADRHGGIQAPETRLPQKGTRVAPQIFTEAREREVGSDHRNVPWSPENVLVDTVARLHRDLADMRAESPFLRTPGVPLVTPTPMHIAFTSTKVPKLAGKTSWEQYRQVFDAIVLSNGWDDVTAALQLLSHPEQ